MNIVDEVNKLHIVAAKVHQEGVNGLSRAKTARLLGLARMSQFDIQKTYVLDVGCWMLNELVSSRNFKAHVEFVDNYLFPKINPGIVQDVELLNKVLAKSRVTDEMKKEIIEILHDGKDLSAVKVSAIQKQNLEKALEKVLFDVNALKGKVFPLNSILRNIERNLTVLNIQTLVHFLLQSSKNKLDAVLSGEGELEISQMALLHLVSILPKKKLLRLEKILAGLLGAVEKFRYDYYLILYKLTPYMDSRIEGKRPGFWMKFFDHDTKVRIPTLGELVQVYKVVQELNKMTADKIKEQLVPFYGENSRVRVYQFGRAKELLEKDDSLTLADVHRKLKTTADVAQFYRAYDKWLKEWSYNDYWLAK